MKATYFIALVAVAALAAGGGWFASQQFGHHHEPAGVLDGGDRKVLFYQSPMHPWIKSDKPGKCTICGMDLVAVYEGSKGFDSAAGITTLNSNTITVINVQTEPVRRQALQRTLRVAGVIDDNDAKHRRLSAYVEGRIDKLHVNYIGAEVVAGQPLAAYYSPMLLAAEREYLTLRQQKLPGTNTSYQNEHQRLINAAALRLKRYGLNDEEIAALESKTSADSLSEILAPLSGTVVSRTVYEGQYVKEGEMLFEIADFSTMWFRFDAYERDLAWIKPGQIVQITTPSVPGKVFTGPITFIDPNLNDMTRSAKVRVDLPNPLVETNGTKRRELLHRLYAEAIVQVEVPEVIAVPRSAVLSPGGEPVVYVDKGGGNYEQRRIKLGRQGDDLAEVLAGLNDGERVVTTGNLMIDAQAQLNQSAQGHEAPVANPTNTTLPAPNETQKTAAQNYLAAINSVTRALSGDNLDGFNTESARLHTAIPALAAAFAESTEWNGLIAPLEKVGLLAPQKDLAAARKVYYPLSTATVELARKLKPQTAFSSLKLYTCPMAGQAVPGAPKEGFWIQLEGPLRNPFFGSQMIDCGSEIKP